MSPLKIGLCLHYHSSVRDEMWIDSGAPIVNDTMAELIADGLLYDMGAGSNPRFKATPKLHAFVVMLEATPLPVQEWMDPRTGKLIEGPFIK